MKKPTKAFSKYKKLADGGDILKDAGMATADAAWQMMAPLSVPVGVATGKDLYGLTGYQSKTDLGQGVQTASGMYSGAQGTVAGSMLGGPTGAMGVNAAQKGINNAFFNNSQQPQNQSIQQPYDNSNQVRLSHMANGGMLIGNNMVTDEYGSGGSIHINPANKGKFNATKAATGKTTEELTHSSNPLTRKRAIFAQNAAKWHHGDGGYMANGGNIYEQPYLGRTYPSYAYGGTIGQNGEFIGNEGNTIQMQGDKHSDNSEGIDYTPGVKVEDGEGIWKKNDGSKYVFSKQLGFADKFDKLNNKYTKLRSNDKLSTDVLNHKLGQLEQDQEIFKATQSVKDKYKQMGNGGLMTQDSLQVNQPRRINLEDYNKMQNDNYNNINYQMQKQGYNNFNIEGVQNGYLQPSDTLNTNYFNKKGYITPIPKYAKGGYIKMAEGGGYDSTKPIGPYNYDPNFVKPNLWDINFPMENDMSMMDSGPREIPSSKPFQLQDPLNPITSTTLKGNENNSPKGNLQPITPSFGVPQPNYTNPATNRSVGANNPMTPMKPIGVSSNPTTISDNNYNPQAGNTLAQGNIQSAPFETGNYSQYLPYLGAGLQAVGDLAYYGKGYNKLNTTNYQAPKYKNYNPALLNPNQALSEADLGTRTQLSQVPNYSNGNSATALNNMLAAGAQGNRNKADIRTNYDNANVGITNAANAANSQGQNNFNLHNASMDYQSRLGNMQDLAQMQNADIGHLSNLGKYGAQGVKDQIGYNTQDKDRAMLGSMFKDATLDSDGNIIIKGTKYKKS